MIRRITGETSSCDMDSLNPLLCVCEYIQTEECPCKGLCNVIEMGHRSVAEALSVEIYALSARALVNRSFIAE
jgi:hypothetical protein